MKLSQRELRGSIATAGVALVLGILCMTAQAQTWEYKSYKKKNGVFDKQLFNIGEVSLEQKDGKAYWHMVAGGTDACLRGDIPATVTKTDAVTTVELQPAMSGCEQIRYVIKIDGSGGDREVKQGEKWVRDTWDHGLTLKK
ncbi:hypothetical protein BH11PSE13_BH11PSE13_32940 [soil metagenome]